MKDTTDEKYTIYLPKQVQESMLQQFLHETIVLLSDYREQVEVFQFRTWLRLNKKKLLKFWIIVEK